MRKVGCADSDPAVENVHRTTRIVPGLGEMAYEDQLSRFKQPTLSYCRLRGDMKETCKIITGVYDRDVTYGFVQPQNSQQYQRLVV